MPTAAIGCFAASVAHQRTAAISVTTKAPLTLSARNWTLSPTLKFAAAFEVEHSTSIYSGIVRMLDLALSVERDTSMTLFLVAPDARRDEVQAQLHRPAFSRVTELGFRYLPYSELQNHRDAMARFGSGLQPLLAASQRM